MIKLFLKYGLLLYIVNTILLSIEVFFSFGYVIFLSIMSLHAFVVLFNLSKVKYILLNKGFIFLLLLTILNMLHIVVSGDILDYESLKYFFARSIQFSIIPFAIYYNIEYYKYKFFDHLVYIIMMLILLGILVDPFIFSGRYQGIFWNPNALSSFSVIGFGILALKSDRKSYLDYAVLFLFLLVSLATGSRGVIVGVILVFLFRYGFSFRNFLYSIFSFFIFYILLEFSLDTSFHRIVSQDIFNDRTYQYYYAIQTFLEKPLLGWGLDKYAYIHQSLVPSYLDTHIISAHNAYIALLVQYGLIFTLIILYIIFYQVFMVINRFINQKEYNYITVYLYLLVYALVGSIYETLITGINEFHTMLFWMALAFLSYIRLSVNEHKDS